jgi:membrane-associated phospholipid phosphatase
MPEPLLRADSALFLLINGFHHPAADLFFRIITFLGDGWVAGPLLIALTFLFIRRNHLVRVLVCGAIGLSLAGIINSQIKHAVHRERPLAHFQKLTLANKDSPIVSGDNASGAIRLLGPAYRSRSFPSGHTNTAFAAATFCALLLGGCWYAAFAAAVAVGYSRIYLGVHFPLDVAAGALLGAAVMLLVMRAGGCTAKKFTKGKSHGEQ